MNIVIFILELTVFFFSSKRVTNIIFDFLNKFFSRMGSMKLFSLIFLPGTFLHEMSHYLTAVVLFVPVGHFNLRPEFEGNSIQMGSVSIAKTDPFRRFLIGVSPVIIGIIIVLFLSYIISAMSSLLQKILVLFLMFVVSNTMFSSRKDMEGAIKLFIFIFFCAVIAYYFDIRINFDLSDNDLVLFNNYFRSGALLLLYPLSINLVILVISRLFSRH